MAARPSKRARMSGVEAERRALALGPARGHEPAAAARQHVRNRPADPVVSRPTSTRLQIKENEVSRPKEAESAAAAHDGRPEKVKPTGQKPSAVELARRAALDRAGRSASDEVLSKLSQERRVTEVEEKTAVQPSSEPFGSAQEPKVGYSGTEDDEAARSADDSLANSPARNTEKTSLEDEGLSLDTLNAAYSRNRRRGNGE